MVQNNYLVLALFLPFILYLNIEVMGRWQTRKGKYCDSVEQKCRVILLLLSFYVLCMVK